jgi:hypothetical protein
MNQEPVAIGTLKNLFDELRSKALPKWQMECGFRFYSWGVLTEGEKFFCPVCKKEEVVSIVKKVVAK